VGKGAPLRAVPTAGGAPSTVRGVSVTRGHAAQGGRFAHPTSKQPTPIDNCAFTVSTRAEMRGNIDILRSACPRAARVFACMLPQEHSAGNRGGALFTTRVVPERHFVCDIGNRHAMYGTSTRVVPRAHRTCRSRPFAARARSIASSISVCEFLHHAARSSSFRNCCESA
jgi:hypothetical protein